jgi:hypothetical protein
MVAVLLSHLHSDARRIDGRGGDGGRDVQIQGADGIHAFEIKSFTGRMSPGRRAHVRSSLARAATLDPVDWTLIVPIDPTPRELTWFDGLRSTVPFPLEWRGLTWLDAEFAQRPSIARYFLKDLKDELIDLATLLHVEEAALLGGGPAVIERAQKLVERANELDPFYRFKVTTDGARSSMTIVPRYPGADRDSPITTTFSLAFPNDEVGRNAADEFQRALDFGTGARVPPEFVRDASFAAPANLGRRLEGASIELMPSGAPGDARRMLLAVVDQSGSTLAETSVSLRITSWGRRGSLLEGGDRSGILSVHVTVDVHKRSFHIKLSVSAHAFFPDEGRPLARLLAVLVKPNLLIVRAEDGSEVGRSEILTDDPLVYPHFPKLVEDLALVQWAAGMSRQVGPDFSRDDIQSLAIGVALLRGERLEASWKRMRIVLSAKAPIDLRRSMLEGEFPFVLRSPQPHVVMIGGVWYAIGRGMQSEVVAARISRPLAAWRASGTIPDGTRLTLVPASSNRALVSLIGG